MAKAFFATTHLLICADSEAEACDVVSALLTENGTHAEPPALIDWSYAVGADDRYAGPRERDIPDDYDRDEFPLHTLAAPADNPLLPCLRSVLVEVAALGLDPLHPLAVMAANAQAEIGRTGKLPPCSEAASESPEHFSDLGVAGWTDADQRAAESEGWAIFDCTGSDNGGFQLCRDDSTMVFESDYEAWMHVWTRMVLDDPLAIKALDFLMVNNPMEYFAIHRFNTPFKG